MRARERTHHAMDVKHRSARAMTHPCMTANRAVLTTPLLNHPHLLYQWLGHPVVGLETPPTPRSGAAPGKAAGENTIKPRVKTWSKHGQNIIWHLEQERELVAEAIRDFLVLKS